MNQEWKGPLRLGAVLFGLYLAIHYWEKLSALAVLAVSASFPLVLGAVIAYAVNILMSMYERWYLPKSTSRAVARSRRPVCLLLAYASLVALVALIVGMILPELIQSVTLLLQELEGAAHRLAAQLIAPGQLQLGGQLVSLFPAVFQQLPPELSGQPFVFHRGLLQTEHGFDTIIADLLSKRPGYLLGFSPGFGLYAG